MTPYLGRDCDLFIVSDGLLWCSVQLVQRQVPVFTRKLSHFLDQLIGKKANFHSPDFAVVFCFILCPENLVWLDGFLPAKSSVKTTIGRI